MLGMNALIDLAHYASQVLPHVDCAGYARLLGLHGERVDKPEKFGPAWGRALAAGGPPSLRW